LSIRKRFFYSIESSILLFFLSFAYAYVSQRIVYFFLYILILPEGARLTTRRGEQVKPEHGWRLSDCNQSPKGYTLIISVMKC
jgi:hypothetical protein